MHFIHHAVKAVATSSTHCHPQLALKESRDAERAGRQGAVSMNADEAEEGSSNNKAQAGNKKMVNKMSLFRSRRKGKATPTPTGKEPAKPVVGVVMD